MTTSEISPFWRDISVASQQVASDHSRTITISSESEGLTAHVSYDTLNEWVSVKILAGKREMKEGDEVATEGTS